jgi:hypothetical protein
MGAEMMTYDERKMLALEWLDDLKRAYPASNHSDFIKTMIADLETDVERLRSKTEDSP